MHRQLVSLILPFLFVSCSAVTSRTPIASRTDPGLQDDLRGVWRAGDGVVFIEFDSSGRGLLAGLDWKEGSHFEMEEMEFVAAERNERLFVSIRDKDEPGKGYYFACYSVSRPDHLIFWNPKVEAFIPYVESGRLAGTVERSQHSTSIQFQDGAQLLQALDHPDALFDFAKPSIFTRVLPREGVVPQEKGPSSPGPGAPPAPPAKP